VKKIIILFCFPAILFSQSKITKSYSYSVNIGPIWMCPYLIPKMKKIFEGLGATNINADSTEVFSFRLDTIYHQDKIKNIFIKDGGFPDWSIKDIKIINEEK